MLFKSFETMDINDGVQRFNETPNAVLLDVREAAEYAQEHISGSVNVPLSVFGTVTRVVPEADTPLFVYCTAGVRSQHACEALTQAGYTDVTNIGGINSYYGEVAHEC